MLEAILLSAAIVFVLWFLSQRNARRRQFDEALEDPPHRHYSHGDQSRRVPPGGNQLDHDPDAYDSADDDDDDFLVEWDNRRAHAEAWRETTVPENRPQGEWVFWKGVWTMNVAGTGHQPENVHKFWNWLCANADADGWFELLMVRDPRNAYDPNAIQVFAKITGGDDRGATLNLGYVPASFAARLAARYDRAMPISGILTRAARKQNHFALEFRGLMPHAAERRQFELANGS